MRSPMICFIVLAVAIFLLAQPVAAQLPSGTFHQISFFRAGPVWSLRPLESAGLFILETNISNLAATDTEAFALSFPPVTGGASDVLAIGPVIAQTSSRTIAAEQCYFYRDFEEV